MELGRFTQVSETEWRVEPFGAMRVPAVLFATAALVRDMDDKVFEQMTNVAMLPGIVEASYAMPDAHWGYGFPIGGVAAFDPEAGGVISAGGVGFDISCGVRTLTTGVPAAEVERVKTVLADSLARSIPAGLGSTGKIHLDEAGMDAMLEGGAQWAVASGWGTEADLERIEEQGKMAGAEPSRVSAHARKRQQDEIGTLGSGNHYLEVQRVAAIYDKDTAKIFGLAEDEVVISIHCGSRGLGHQIGTEFLAEMLGTAATHHITLPDRELACAPINSDVGQAYLGAMRAAVNCAFANRQILTHLTRRTVGHYLPAAELKLLYDVSHNTCKEERHEIDGRKRRLFVHRKGATRAFRPGHPDLPEALRDVGQPVLIGGSMGTHSYVLAGGTRSASAFDRGGPEAEPERAFSSACHGAGRAMSRHQALKQWRGRAVVDELAQRGILIRSPSWRGVAEEAPGAYKDVGAVVEAAEKAGLARRVARLDPIICVKG
jgi:tRNA-splicing ligase RtcB (3'-phosphate/5'-hydroxy nucleic acid ligase)